MIMSKMVELRWGARNKNYYINKGYKFTKMKDIFLVSVEDLTHSSCAIITVLCDYCNNNKIYMQYNEYNKRRRESPIQKDCCDKCQKLKAQESNMLLYGVKNAAQRVELRNNISERSLLSNDLIRKQFKDKEYLLLSTEKINDKSVLKFICKKHEQMGVQHIKYRNFKRNFHSCKYCHYEYISSILSCTNERNIFNYFREKIISWKNETMKMCNYKCVLSGERFDDIHHLYGFNLIIYESLNELNMKFYANKNKYTTQELKTIEIKIIEKHIKYGCGVCLCKNLHLLFHTNYGSGNNTPSQFEEFKQRLQTGEFNDFLILNNLKLII